MSIGKFKNGKLQIPSPAPGFRLDIFGENHEIFFFSGIEEEITFFAKRNFTDGEKVFALSNPIDGIYTKCEIVKI